MPLAVSHIPAELEHVIADADTAIVVGGGRHADALEAIAASRGARFIRMADLLAETDAVPLHVTALPERRAMIVYTSGTTGVPKGVVTTHGQLDAQIASLVSAWEWTPADVALLVLPLHHVHGIINVVGCALAAGAACEMLPQFEVESAWERLASGEITVFTAVPTSTALIAAWDARAGPEAARSEVPRRSSDDVGLRCVASAGAERWRGSPDTLLGVRHDGNRDGAREPPPWRQAADTSERLFPV